MADDKPIIVIKKKGGHGGHHGGAWKVAYADFVTAMMAFFMVMWLVNSADVTTKQNIASYFKKPGLFQQGSGTPLMIGQSGILEDAYVPTKRLLKNETHEEDSKEEEAAGDGQNRGNAQEKGKGEAQAARELEKARLQQAGDQIQQMIQSSPELQDLLGIVDVKLEADGLNIEIMDTEKSSMFGSGSARILGDADSAFAKIAKLISPLSNKIDILGHTDAKPFASRKGGYSNWELSSDRANAARRVLEREGIPRERIRSVVGRADRDLRAKEEPFNASNRRITLKLRFENTALPLRDTFASDPNLRVLPDRRAEEVHSFTPRQITQPDDYPDRYAPANRVKASKKKYRGAIQLPEQATEDPFNSNLFGRDSVFSDSPVVGPKELFGR